MEEALAAAFLATEEEICCARTFNTYGSGTTATVAHMRVSHGVLSPTWALLQHIGCRVQACRAYLWHCCTMHDRTYGQTPLTLLCAAQQSGIQPTCKLHTCCSACMVMALPSCSSSQLTTLRLAFSRVLGDCRGGICG